MLVYQREKLGSKPDQWNSRILKWRFCTTEGHFLGVYPQFEFLKWPLIRLFRGSGFSIYKWWYVNDDWNTMVWRGQSCWILSCCRWTWVWRCVRAPWSSVGARQGSGTGWKWGDGTEKMGISNKSTEKVWEKWHLGTCTRFRKSRRTDLLIVEVLYDLLRWSDFKSRGCGAIGFNGMLRSTWWLGCDVWLKRDMLTKC